MAHDTEKLRELPPMDADKFWPKVGKAGDDECWEWLSYRQHGYGKWAWAKGFAVKAHRAAFLLSKGPIPEGMCVCHTCDNPGCCNPNHLWIGTVAENNQDRSRKGRSKGPDRDPETVNWATGERHGCSKITAEDAAVIRSSAESLSVLGRRYGIHPVTVSKIKRGLLWRRALISQAEGEAKHG